MERASLIYNPRSGRQQRLREKTLRDAAATLREAGVHVQVEATEHPGHGTELARKAAAQGCDAVIACGGDGTVMEVLQGLVNTDVALGVLPMGTKNALACELGIPTDPQRAARLLAAGDRVRVAVGKAEFERRGGGRGECYFMSAAGIGADAEMMYRLATNFSRRLGMWSYYREGLRVFLGHDYREFETEIRTLGGELRRERVSDLLAVRLSGLGGLLSRLAPGAALNRDGFRLVLFKTRGRWPYLVYAAGVVSRRGWLPKEIEMLDASEVRCVPAPETKRVCVQADGESLGTAPATLKMVHDACLLLVPKKSGYEKN